MLQVYISTTLLLEIPSLIGNSGNGDDGNKEEAEDGNCQSILFFVRIA